MGSPLAIIPLLIVLALIVWLLFSIGVFGASARGGAIGERLQGDELRYPVPEGQDPAAVLAVLAHHGYHGGVIDAHGERVVTIDRSATSAEDREAVRAVIAEAGTALQDAEPMKGPVRFEDELPDGPARSARPDQSAE